jgi:hypothetical protein
MFLNKTGGISSWSEAVYALAEWFKTNQHSAIFAFDQGNARVIFFLLGGKEIIYDLSEESESDYIRDIHSFCSYGKGSMLYRICQQNDPAKVARFDLLKKTVEGLGETLIEEKTFYRRDGAAAYIVYSIH